MSAMRKPSTNTDGSSFRLGAEGDGSLRSVNTIIARKKEERKKIKGTWEEGCWKLTRDGEERKRWRRSMNILQTVRQGIRKQLEKKSSD